MPFANNPICSISISLFTHSFFLPWMWLQILMQQCSRSLTHLWMMLNGWNYKIFIWYAQKCEATVIIIQVFNHSWKWHWNIFILCTLIHLACSRSSFYHHRNDINISNVTGCCIYHHYQFQWTRYLMCFLKKKTIFTL